MTVHFPINMKNKHRDYVVMQHAAVRTSCHCSLTWLYFLQGVRCNCLLVFVSSPFSQVVCGSSCRGRVEDVGSKLCCCNHQSFPCIKMWAFNWNFGACPPCAPGAWWQKGFLWEHRLQRIEAFTTGHWTMQCRSWLVPLLQWLNNNNNNNNALFGSGRKLHAWQLVMVDVMSATLYCFDCITASFEWTLAFFLTCDSFYVPTCCVGWGLCFDYEFEAVGQFSMLWQWLWLWIRCALDATNSACNEFCCACIHDSWVFSACCMCRHWDCTFCTWNENSYTAGNGSWHLDVCCNEPKGCWTNCWIICFLVYKVGVYYSVANGKTELCHVSAVDHSWVLK